MRAVGQEEHAAEFELYPLGEAAVVIRVNPGPSPTSTGFDASRARLAAFVRLLEKERPPAITEWVQTYATVTLFYDVWSVYRDGFPPGTAEPVYDTSERRERTPYEQVCAWIERLLGSREHPAGAGADAVGCGARQAGLAAAGGATAEAVAPEEEAIPATHVAPAAVEIPVCFADDLGADLREVADRAGMSPGEVIRLFCSADYEVQLIGFLPGFPYLGGLPAKLAHPRKAVPRQKVPAGSVAIGGVQAGIYPMEAPGGWQLIGRTPYALFDAERERPSLLQAGDRVRFVPVDRAQYDELARDPAAGWLTREEGRS
ncbi:MULTISPECIES: 5-oxoprolinase subunit PxpB [Paenibacillus]|uniref:5-oxoprolinase subunit PxpB n=1 Tax=Paenibacillus validus TaxID=44253 RepID=A0A7X2ZFI1_9BACL|nr:MULTISPECIES: 5-oxoprolinase subunit PxpB [Paenibacillus]MUG73980.1 5-oxoprolinase subunit PxpB [Paenibacillus validus]